MSFHSLLIDLVIVIEPLVLIVSVICVCEA